jgi:inosine-uridine nucleoside N-ribohydrolase
MVPSPRRKYCLSEVFMRVWRLTLFCLVLGLGEVQAQPKQKIILDFDLGGDIDDAFALALVLTSPEFDVIGITLDHGLTEERARVACKILYETGREEIPVAVGRTTPNIVGKDKDPEYSPQFLFARGFEKIRPIRQPAADFIIEQLHKYPHEIVLFTTGPVPNMADIVRKDPGALKLAKKIYAMFGSFYLGYGSKSVPDAEWNVAADVESARLFAEAGAEIVYAGLDITTFVSLEADQRMKILMRNSPLTDALCSLYALWGNETPILYDVVAIAQFLWPDLFTWRPAHIRVLDGGFTVVDESHKADAWIGMSVNKEELIRRIMARYIRQSLGRP